MQTNEILIQPASEVPLHELVRALNLAYADYYVHISHTVDSFRSLMKRESVRLEASAVAMAGQRIIGMGLLAVRDDRGWIGGVGVLPRHRGHSVGRTVMRSLIEQGYQLGLSTLQLEVIRENTTAYRLYESLGFETVRQLLVLYRPYGVEPPPLNAESLGVTLRRMPAYTVLDGLADLIMLRRPWQRQLAGLRQIGEMLEGIGAWDATGKLTGAAVYRAEGGQVAIMDAAANTPEIGEALVTQILNRSRWNDISYVNVPDDDPLLPMLFQQGFQENLGQYEMFLALNSKDGS